MVLGVSKRILDALSRELNVSRMALGAFRRALGVSKGYWCLYDVLGCL